MFVPLSDNVNTDDLQLYFPRAKILEWDTDKDLVPYNWPPLFDEAFGCGRL